MRLGERARVRKRPVPRSSDFGAVRPRAAPLRRHYKGTRGPRAMDIAVLGSGTMGHGIAQISAVAGHSVALRDVKQEFLDKAMEKIGWSLSKSVEKKKMSGSEAEAALGRISATTDLAKAAGGADMVVEAVPEIMELKKKVYAELDAAARPDAVFASNTSTLPITEMAQATADPSRFVGVHFFNPPQLMKLVEIIPGRLTDPAVLEKTSGYVESLRKESVVCRKDVPGFIVNRLFIPAVHEACHAADESGASLQEIDSAVKFKLGFPMGMFELADYTGLDVIHKATSEMVARDPSSANPHPRVAELFEAGRLGRKSGSGFYEHSGEHYGRVQLSEELAGRFDPLRLVAALANSAARLSTMGASSADETERAARLGLGLRKTIAESAAEAGARAVLEKLEALEKDGPFYAPDPSLAPGGSPRDSPAN